MTAVVPPPETFEKLSEQLDDVTTRVCALYNRCDLAPEEVAGMLFETCIFLRMLMERLMRVGMRG